MSEQREVNADRTPMQREVLAVIRDLDQRHGSRWEWKDQLRTLFVACRLSKCDVDQDLRMSFQREMHQMIPIGEYSRQRVEQSVDQIIALVQHYHRWASGTGTAAAT